MRARSRFSPAPELGWRGSLVLRKPPMHRRSMPFLYRKVNRSGVGCHDLGVCDKVVLDLDLSSFHNRSLPGLHEISLILTSHRRHGLVADSKTVAPIPQAGNLRFHAESFRAAFREPSPFLIPPMVTRRVCWISAYAGTTEYWVRSESTC